MPRCANLQEVLASAKPGDILLTNRPRSKVSTLIRLLSGSPVSHAILSLGDEQFVMAHLPKKPEDTVIQKYDPAGLEAERFNSMFCYRHQDLDPHLNTESTDESALDAARTKKADAIGAILDTAERFAEGTGNYRFATTDMVIGAALALIRPTAWVLRVLERLPGLREAFMELRDLMARHAGGEAKLFCSEFVSRCFLHAATTHEEARIDTSFMIMRHWAAILAGQEPIRSLAPYAAVEQQAPDDTRVLQTLAELDELSASDEVDDLAILPDVDELEITNGQVRTAPVPDTPVRRSAWLRTEDQELVGGFSAEQRQTMSDLLEMRDALAGLSWQTGPSIRSTARTQGPDIADFITPVDLLRSPSLRAIAWWGSSSLPPEW